MRRPRWPGFSSGGPEFAGDSASATDWLARCAVADRPKGGGGRRRVALDAVVGCFEGQKLEVVTVHGAPDRLAEQDGRQAQVMTLRHFGGMTVAEVAAAPGGSVVTVENDWRLAWAWLAGQLGGWDG